MVCVVIELSTKAENHDFKFFRLPTTDSCFCFVKSNFSYCFEESGAKYVETKSRWISTESVYPLTIAGVSAVHNLVNIGLMRK